MILLTSEYNETQNDNKNGGSKLPPHIISTLFQTFYEKLQTSYRFLEFADGIGIGYSDKALAAFTERVAGDYG